MAAAAGLPAVDMESVIKAAQWDPAKPDPAVTAGAGPSVRLVETALCKLGLLEASYVDGHFGTRTVTAYAQWQKQLGHSGLDATGLPSRISLATLSEAQFTLTRVVTPGAVATFKGLCVKNEAASV